VGVGGLATAGGIGFLARKHGLTIDHLRAVEMVLADGTLVRASATENSELFWAARGAGANFGVAVAFEFEVDEVAEVGWAQLGFQAPDPAAYLEAFGRVVAETPRETTPFLRWFEPVRRQSEGLYLSFESDRHPDRIADAFPPATLDRLRRLKTELDPHNLFRDNFNIIPAHETRSAS